MRLSVQITCESWQMCAQKTIKRHTESPNCIAVCRKSVVIDRMWLGAAVLVCIWHAHTTAMTKERQKKPLFVTSCHQNVAFIFESVRTRLKKMSLTQLLLEAKCMRHWTAQLLVMLILSVADAIHFPSLSHVPFTCFFSSFLSHFYPSCSSRHSFGMCVL